MQGVYTNAAIQLSTLLSSPAFRVWATMLSVALVSIWLLCVTFTVRAIYIGDLVGPRRGWRRTTPPLT